MDEFNPNGWNADTTLAKHYKVSRVTIWRWARAGKLQKPIKLGPNTTRWFSDGRKNAA